MSDINDQESSLASPTPAPSTPFSHTNVQVLDLIGAADEAAEAAAAAERAARPVVHAPFHGTVMATGRRKTAVARVTLTSGKGVITVNGREFDDYFNTPVGRAVSLQSLSAVDGLKRFDVKVKAHGGGSTGQAGAMSLGIARALLLVDVNYRPLLKKEGLLTRDSREKERKKSGQPGARKRFQFSKR